jgi:uncharacterized protein (TIGR03437 family)
LTNTSAKPADSGCRNAHKPGKFDVAYNASIVMRSFDRFLSVVIGGSEPVHSVNRSLLLMFMLLGLDVGFFTQTLSAQSQSQPAVGRAILFVHGLCDTANSWSSLETSVINYVMELQPSLYTNSVPWVVYYDTSSQSVKSWPNGQDFLSTVPSPTRFFALNFFDPSSNNFSTINSVNVAQVSILNKGDELARVIQAITTLSRVKDVIVVAHSQGGLASRAYTENLAIPFTGNGCSDQDGYQCSSASSTYYTQDISKLITLDTPNSGAEIANWASWLPSSSIQCFTENTLNRRELQEASPVIGKLNADVTSAPVDLVIASIQSYTDPGFPFPSAPDGDEVVTLQEQSIQAVAPTFASYYDVPDYLGSYTSFYGLKPYPPLHFLTVLDQYSITANTVEVELAKVIVHGPPAQTTSISVQAGAAVSYSLSGPTSLSGTGSQIFYSVPIGTYTLTYAGGNMQQTLGVDHSSGANNWSLTFTVPLPSNQPVVNAVVNAFSGSPSISENTWVTITGSNLAPDTRNWQAADFVNNTMPTSLNGVTVTLNGKNAYIYYISGKQLNVLTPPDLGTGAIQVLITNNGATSPPFTVQAQQLSPSFFTFEGVHVTATHADGSILGPTSLYPGVSTPAQPNETVILYANGFGPTTTPVTTGAVKQSGGLPVLPVVKINGTTAAVEFAGLVSPGTYQFNVVVPASAPSGDDTLTAVYGGLTTQAGVYIAVAPATHQVVLDFDTLKCAEFVNNYYAGGFGSLGTGPGPNYGISFSSSAGWGAQVQTDAKLLIPGCAVQLDGQDTTNMPSPSNGVIFQSPLAGASSPNIMNVPAGFTGGLSFYYASPAYGGYISIWSGLNATGTLLATINMPATGGCPSTPVYCIWNSMGMTFSGLAKSVDFGGSIDFTVFDNITLAAAPTNN